MILDKAQKALDDLIFTIEDWGETYFDFEVEINSNKYRFTGCDSNTEFDELYVNGEYFSLGDNKDLILRVNGYVFSIGDIYRSLFFTAESAYHDAYNEAQCIMAAEERHNRSFWRL